MKFAIAAAAVLAVSAIKLEREPTNAEAYAQLNEEEKAQFWGVAARIARRAAPHVIRHAPAVIDAASNWF